MAGVDQESERLAYLASASQRGIAERIDAANDTFAVLRAGAPDGIGVGVVCGAGMNAVGVPPSGEVVRFAALGSITGDWGGGADLGLAALGSAVRAEDGRDPNTVLASGIARHSAARARSRPRSPCTAVRSLSSAWSSSRRSSSKPRRLETRRRQADRADGPRVEKMAATASRLAFGEQPHRIILGGGLLSPPSALTRELTKLLAQSVPAAKIEVCDVAPVAGAAAAALELAGAGPQAVQRARADLRADSTSNATATRIGGAA